MSSIFFLGVPAMSADQPDIAKFFNEFSYENIDLADSFYAKDVVFEDPLGRIEGLADLKKYYAGLYKSVITIRFEFSSVIRQGNEEVGIWVMHLKTEKLNGGKEFALKGNSHVRYNAEGKVVYHRDYFDMGEFIYEQVPILSSLIQFIKKRLKH